MAKRRNQKPPEPEPVVPTEPTRTDLPPLVPTEPEPVVEPSDRVPAPQPKEKK